MGHAAAAAALPHAGCSSAEPTAAVLEVDATRALVSVWSGAHVSAEVRLEDATGMVRARSSGELGDHGTGVVRLAGLAPGTAYRAFVHLDGAERLERTFTTAPSADDARDVRLAVIADVDPHRDNSLFDEIASAAADLTVSLGDWPYVDDAYDAGPITAAEIVSRHAEARSASRIQPWLERTSLRAIYDDHEVRNNWCGGDPASEVRTHRLALAIWDDFFPRLDAGPRYRRWRWGAHLECFLLDTRRYRSPSSAPDGPAKTMLGREQLAWLIEGVTTSPAPFKIVFTSVPLDFGHGHDHWSGYRFERDLILDTFARSQTTGILFVSADQHWFAAHVHRHGFRELQVGPASRGVFEPPAASAGVLGRAVERNFGLVEVGSRGLRFRAIGVRGRTLHDETFAPEDLRATRPSSR
jgi:alkaline phosphatase D